MEGEDITEDEGLLMRLWFYRLAEEKRGKQQQRKQDGSHPVKVGTDAQPVPSHVSIQTKKVSLTILGLSSEIASGMYMVNITVNGECTVQRLSIIR